MEGNNSIYFINYVARLSGSPSNFVYDLQIPDGSGYDSVAVMTCNIPVSYYIIQAGYNTFRIVENDVHATITIPIGNYSANSFITTVLPLINGASPNRLNYTMTMPNQFAEPSTAKYSFTVSSTSIVVGFIYTTNVHEQFGFNANSSNFFVSGSLTSTNVVKFVPEDTLLLHSDICDNGDNSILQEIFANNSSTYSNIVYQCNAIECYSRKLRTNSSNTYTFSLTSKSNRLIDLNGLNMVFTLVLFKRSNFSKVFKQFIKYQLGS